MCEAAFDRRAAVESPKRFTVRSPGEPDTLVTGYSITVLYSGTKCYACLIRCDRTPEPPNSKPRKNQYVCFTTREPGTTPVADGRIYTTEHLADIACLFRRRPHILDSLVRSIGAYDYLLRANNSEIV